MSITKTIRSRSNKNIGDVIEEKWEITAKTVIAEPQPGDVYRSIPPRLGIYEYEVKPIVQQAPAKAASGEKRVLQERRRTEPDVGGTRREASTAPVVRRVN